jgi:hypothetical protein
LSLASMRIRAEERENEQDTDRRRGVISRANAGGLVGMQVRFLRQAPECRSDLAGGKVRLRFQFSRRSPCGALSTRRPEDGG